MKRLLVNDALNQLGEVTFWNLLHEWFSMQPVLAPYEGLAHFADTWPEPASLIVRNATYFPALELSKTVPTISLLQDIIADRPMREMQIETIRSSRAVVLNSAFTQSKYPCIGEYEPPVMERIIPLPIDFSLFQPANPMGLQQALGLPDGCVLWVGACQGAAGQVKGWDIFIRIVRANVDIPFVAVVKDAPPDVVPPNLRVYVRLPHAELVKVMGACRVGLCTSRTESQHLAGIEMGACGLPIVAPPVGVYWNRTDFPGGICKPDHTPCADAIRVAMRLNIPPDTVRSYWQREFDRPVIKAQWEQLIKEIECSGQS